MSYRTNLMLALAVLGLLGGASSAQAGFVHSSGTQLTLDGKLFMPYGVGHMDVSSLWVATSTEAGDKWVTEQDFKNLAQNGFNSIRLSVKTDYFQDVKPPHKFSDRGFAWLDRRVAWANKYGLRLILDMHMPTGGAPQDYRINASSQTFWEDPWLKGRFVDVWREIARHYANETAIWAYEPMNEPATWDYEAYERLMSDTVKAIRSQDKNHLILVQSGMYVHPDWTVDFIYPKISDENLAHSVHFYQPVDFTHHNVYWGVVGEKARTSYPDLNSNLKPWTSTDTKRAFAVLAADATSTGVPAVLTEFGTVFHDKNVGQTRWIQDVLEAAATAGMGWHYWYYKGPAYAREMGLTIRGGQPRPLSWALLKKFAVRQP